jgi:hypothetical protein
VGDKYVPKGAVFVAVERRLAMPFYLFQVFIEKDEALEMLVNEDIWQNVFNISSPKELYIQFRDTRNVAWSLKLTSIEDCKKLLAVFEVYCNFYFYIMFN